MEILFYVLLILTITALIYLLFKNKNLFIIIICSLLIIQIIISPKLCIDGAINGAVLFFYKVFPSLFSFLVVSNVIINCNGIYIYSKLFGKALCRPLRLPINCSFAIVISILCGYPLGAKYACDLYENQEIDIYTLQRLLNIASNSSPIFMLGSVGISMFNSVQIGYLFLISNLISCMVMGFILPVKKKYKNIPYIKHKSNITLNIGNIFKSSIETSIKTCLSIGGFVTAFSVINNMLQHNFIFYQFTDKISQIFNISNEVVQGTLLGIIEMTNGCNLISTSHTEIFFKVLIISFLLTFSGFSIISQVYSFTYKFNISMKRYIFRKLLHGIICSIISISIFKIYETKISKETFFYYFTSSSNSNILFIITLILLILPFLLFKLRQLFHIS